LGSRNSQTTYYWNAEKEQVVCGCFKGTLQEFEDKVKLTHGDNDYAKAYLQWIEKVKIYRGYKKKIILWYLYKITRINWFIKKYNE
jgi:hypothetical protein